MKKPNNNKKIINERKLTEIDLDENTINTDKFSYLTNNSVYKERKVRDSSFSEPNFQTDALINLIKRLKNNVTNLIDIKNTNEYLKLKRETYLLQVSIANDKRLLFALNNKN